LLSRNVLLAGIVDGRQFSWDVEVDSRTVFLAQTQVHELAFRGIIKELTWWPHLQKKRQTELIVVATDRAAVLGLGIKSIDDGVVDFC
jgi:hypothetical protein